MEKNMNKWAQWYNSLSPSTKEYLKGQAIWTDGDLAKFAMLAFIGGVVVGVLA
jgi:hypothetical protein